MHANCVLLGVSIDLWACTLALADVSNREVFDEDDDASSGGIGDDDGDDDANAEDALVTDDCEYVL